MSQLDTMPRVSLPSAPLVELRGPSGKLYGELDTQTGIIIFRRGKLPAERIDLTPYFTAAIVNADDHR